MRILVTGSRNWENEARIRFAFRTMAQQYAATDITVVHGACPTGADALADKIAREWGFHVETHPADWGTHGKRAGFVRNAHMADLGADMCLAFPLGESKGTRMMMDLAMKKHIPVYNFGEEK